MKGPLPAISFLSVHLPPGATTDKASEVKKKYSNVVFFFFLDTDQMQKNSNNRVSSLMTVQNEPNQYALFVKNTVAHLFLAPFGRCCITR